MATTRPGPVHQNPPQEHRCSTHSWITTNSGHETPDVHAFMLTSYSFFSFTVKVDQPISRFLHCLRDQSAVAVGPPGDSAAECRVCGSVALEVFFPLFFFFFATHRYTITYHKIREYIYIYVKKKGKSCNFRDLTLGRWFAEELKRQVRALATYRTHLFK